MDMCSLLDVNIIYFISFKNIQNTIRYYKIHTEASVLERKQSIETDSKYTDDRLSEKDFKQLSSYMDLFKGKHEFGEKRNGRLLKRQNETSRD